MSETAGRESTSRARILTSKHLLKKYIYISKGLDNENDGVVATTLAEVRYTSFGGRGVKGRSGDGTGEREGVWGGRENHSQPVASPTSI